MRWFDCLPQFRRQEPAIILRGPPRPFTDVYNHISVISSRFIPSDESAACPIHQLAQPVTEPRPGGLYQHVV